MTQRNRDQDTDRDAGRRLSTADMAATGRQPRQRGEPDEPLAPPPIDETREGRAAPREQTGAGDDSRSVALLAEEQLASLRERWVEVQTGFVDEPRRSVEQADALVADVMRRLAEGFADERENLERQWSGGGDVSTEDLRQALRRYRSFFDRLLSI